MKFRVCELRMETISMLMILAVTPRCLTRSARTEGLSFIATAQVLHDCEDHQHRNCFHAQFTSTKFRVSRRSSTLNFLLFEDQFPYSISAATRTLDRDQPLDRFATKADSRTRSNGCERILSLSGGMETV